MNLLLALAAIAAVLIIAVVALSAPRMTVGTPYFNWPKFRERWFAPLSLAVILAAWAFVDRNSFTEVVPTKYFWAGVVLWAATYMLVSRPVPFESSALRKTLASGMTMAGLVLIAKPLWPAIKPARASNYTGQRNFPQAVQPVTGGACYPSWPTSPSSLAQPSRFERQADGSWQIFWTGNEPDGFAFVPPEVWPQDPAKRIRLRLQVESGHIDFDAGLGPQGEHIWRPWHLGRSYEPTSAARSYFCGNFAYPHQLKRWLGPGQTAVIVGPIDNPRAVLPLADAGGVIDREFAANDRPVLYVQDHDHADNGWSQGHQIILQLFKVAQ